MGITIAYIILITIVIWKVFGRNYGGELILTLEKKGKNSRWNKAVWFALLIIWAILLIYHLVNYKGNFSSMGSNLRSPIFWIIFSLLQIIRGYGPTEIREKGMYFNNNFYKYSKLISYTWLEEDVLRVNYKNIFREDDYFEIEINDKNTALKADEALAKYIL